ncbi:MAG: ABC transporter substrate-binding protein [Caldicoprobacterales bacterium]
MGKLKSIIAMLLVMLLALSLITACGQKPSEEADKQPDQEVEVEDKDKEDDKEDAPEPEDDVEIDTSKFVEVVWYHLGDPPTNEQLNLAAEEWNKILEEKVNAHLKINFIEWADYLTKYNLMLASREVLDMINTASDWLDMWPNAAKGAFMDITDLLPKYAPQTWSEVPEEHWDQCKFDGKIITIPEDQYTQWVNHGFYYRGDWAEEFGITEPIRHWDTLGEYLQKVKDIKGVIPYDVAGSKANEILDYWMAAYTDSICLEIPGNIFYSKSYDDLYTVYSPIFDDTMVEMAKKMKEWGDAGYWRNDVLNYTGDTREALKAGQTGLDGHHTQTYAGLRVDMDEKQPGSDLQMFPMHLQGGKNLVEMSITHGAQSVAASSENPERALMVYDLMRNDETLYRLLNFGREGVNYEIVDGKRTRPADFDETEHGFYSNFWGGRMDKFEMALPSDRVYDKIGDLYAIYDQYKKPYPYAGFVFDKTPVETELAALNDVKTRHQGPLAFGKAGDPVAAVEKFREELMSAGYDIVLAEVQRQIDEWKASR